MSDNNLHWNKIYVNSFFKQSGDDTAFRVNIPTISFTELSLDSCVCDCIFTNLYQS